MKCSTTGHCSPLKHLPKVLKPSPQLWEHVELFTNHFRMKCYSRHTAPPSMLSLTARLRLCSRGVLSGWSSASGCGACHPGRCHQGRSCHRARPRRHGRLRWGWWVWPCEARTSPLRTTQREVVSLCAAMKLQLFSTLISDVKVFHRLFSTNKCHLIDICTISV